MRNIVFTIVVVLLCSTSVYTQIVDNKVQYAEELYASQKYDSVIQIYTELLQADYSDSYLYYNLANAYFKNRDLAFAILNYEKALLLAPFDKDIVHNLKIANAKQVDVIENLSQRFLLEYYQSMYRLFTVNTWAYIALGNMVILLIGLCIFLFTRSLRFKKISFWLACVHFFVCAISISNAFARYDEQTSGMYAILIEPNVTIKLEPQVHAANLAVVHEGVKVRILREYNGWVNVRLVNNKEGWVQIQTLARIKLP